MNCFCDLCGMSHTAITISLSGVRLLYGAFKQPRQFCETSTEVTNYVNAFCETMWKTGATEIEFWHLPLGVPVSVKTRVSDRLFGLNAEGTSRSSHPSTLLCV